MSKFITIKKIKENKISNDNLSTESFEKELFDYLNIQANSIDAFYSLSKSQDQITIYSFTLFYNRNINYQEQLCQFINSFTTNKKIDLESFVSIFNYLASRYVKSKYLKDYSFLTYSKMIEVWNKMYNMIQMYSKNTFQGSIAIDIFEDSMNAIIDEVQQEQIVNDEYIAQIKHETIEQICSKCINSNYQFDIDKIQKLINIKCTHKDCQSNNFIPFQFCENHLKMNLIIYSKIFENKLSNNKILITRILEKQSEVKNQDQSLKVLNQIRSKNIFEDKDLVLKLCKPISGLKILTFDFLLMDFHQTQQTLINSMQPRKSLVFSSQGIRTDQSNYLKSYNSVVFDKSKSDLRPESRETPNINLNQKDKEQNIINFQYQNNNNVLQSKNSNQKYPDVLKMNEDTFKKFHEIERKITVDKSHATLDCEDEYLSQALSKQDLIAASQLAHGVSAESFQSNQHINKRLNESKQPSLQQLQRTMTSKSELGLPKDSLVTNSLMLNKYDTHGINVDADDSLKIVHEELTIPYKNSKITNQLHSLEKDIISHQAPIKNVFLQIYQIQSEDPKTQLSMHQFLSLLDSKFINELGQFVVQEFKDFIDSDYEGYLMEKVFMAENRPVQKWPHKLKSADYIPIETFFGINNKNVIYFIDYLENTYIKAGTTSLTLKTLIESLNKFKMSQDSKILTELIHCQTLNSNYLKTNSKINLALPNTANDNVILDLARFFGDLTFLFSQHNRGFEDSATLIHSLMVDHIFQLKLLAKYHSSGVCPLKYFLNSVQFREPKMYLVVSKETLMNVIQQQTLNDNFRYLDFFQDNLQTYSLANMDMGANPAYAHFLSRSFQCNKSRQDIHTTSRVMRPFLISDKKRLNKTFTNDSLRKTSRSGSNVSIPQSTSKKRFLQDSFVKNNGERKMKFKQQLEMKVVKDQD